MANKPYANTVLANEVENQFTSMIDHAIFCTVDNTLAEAPGMTKVIRKYYGKVTTPAAGQTPESSQKDGVATEKLALKAGNTKFIEMDYGSSDYTVLTAQNTGIWYDEEQMKDPYVGLVIAKRAGEDLFNTMNADIMTAFGGASSGMKVTVASNDFFGAFVDAQAKLNIEAVDMGAPSTFALVNVAGMATLRKKLGESLKYVESFARTGYVGTVAGTNIYVSKIVPANKIYVATKEAVTLFVKTGTEVEDYQIYNRSSADADIRKNTMISRKYYIAALTDATKLAEISWS